MKKLFLIIFFAFALTSCYRSFIKTGAISEQNRINMGSLEIGMSQDQVLDIMGHPYKTEERQVDNKIYDVWYYITEPTILGQTQLVTKNFTPVVFESGVLKGWGRNFYKFIFNVNNEKWKRAVEKKQKYTNDKEEWPRNEHLLISPVKEKNESSESPEKQELQENNKIKPALENMEEENPKDQLQSTSTPKLTDESNQKETQCIQPKCCKKPRCCIKKQPEPNEIENEENEEKKSHDERCNPSNQKEIFIFWE